LRSYYKYSSTVASLIKIPKISDNIGVRLTKTRNTRSEQLFMMPTELLTE